MVPNIDDHIVVRDSIEVGSWELTVDENTLKSTIVILRKNLETLIKKT